MSIKVKIPEKLYNPNQEDQSIRGYINVYDNLIDRFFDGYNSGLTYLLPELSRQEISLAGELCLKINIALRMLHILEKHCGEEPNLIIS